MPCHCLPPPPPVFDLSPPPDPTLILHYLLVDEPPEAFEKARLRLAASCSLTWWTKMQADDLLLPSLALLFLCMFLASSIAAIVLRRRRSVRCENGSRSTGILIWRSGQRRRTTTTASIGGHGVDGTTTMSGGGGEAESDGNTHHKRITKKTKKKKNVKRKQAKSSSLSSPSTLAMSSSSSSSTSADSPTHCNAVSINNSHRHRQCSAGRSTTQTVTSGVCAINNKCSPSTQPQQIHHGGWLFQPNFFAVASTNGCGRPNTVAAPRRKLTSGISCSPSSILSPNPRPVVALRLPRHFSSTECANDFGQHDEQRQFALRTTGLPFGDLTASNDCYIGHHAAIGGSNELYEELTAEADIAEAPYKLRAAAATATTIAHSRQLMTNTGTRRLPAPSSRPPPPPPQLPPLPTLPIPTIPNGGLPPTLGSHCCCALPNKHCGAGESAAETSSSSVTADEAEANFLKCNHHGGRTTSSTGRTKMGNVCWSPFEHQHHQQQQQCSCGCNPLLEDGYVTGSRVPNIGVPTSAFCNRQNQIERQPNCCSPAWSTTNMSRVVQNGNAGSNMNSRIPSIYSTVPASEDAEDEEYIIQQNAQKSMTYV